MRAHHILSVFFVATLLLATGVLADTHERDFDTIDNAPEEKERALVSINHTISEIKAVLDRCETDVCRSVRANADKRHELTHVAQQDSGVALRNVQEIEVIVREDIATLERCREDVCARALVLEEDLLMLVRDYLDLDSDGDGLDDGTERGGDLDGDGIPDIEIGAEAATGFGSFFVKKRAERTSTFSDNQIVAPDMIAVARGGGAGKVSLLDIALEVCPQERCTTEIHIEIENSPPVAARFSEGFIGQGMALELPGVGDVVWDLRADTRCQEMRGTIHCTRGDELALFMFMDVSQTTCTQQDDELWCWGTARDGAETQARFLVHRQTPKTDFGSTACIDDDCDDTDSDIRPGAIPDSCVVVRDSCPEDARADGKCIVKSDVCRDDNQERCVHVAERCPDNMRADGSCVVAADVCGQGTNRAAIGACPDGEALCMDGTCEPIMQDPRCGNDLQIASGEELFSSDATDRRPIHRDIAVAQRARDKSTPLLYQGLRSDDLDEEDREGLGVYLRNKSELRGEDFGLAVAYAASNNQQVRSVRYNNETDEVEVEHVQDVRLFGFIPVRATARSTVSSDGEVSTRMPWWSRLGTREADSTHWMTREGIGDYLDMDDDGDGIPTTVGRNPQTGKEIQIVAKSIDKASPALAKASSHIQQGNETWSVDLDVRTRSVLLDDGDEIVCGELTDGTPACAVSRDGEGSVYCWGANERSLTEDACPTSREGIEIAVEKIERTQRLGGEPFDVLETLLLNDSSVLLVVHTGDVPDEDEVEMNKAELIEAMASNAGLRMAAGGYIKIGDIKGEAQATIPPSINSVAINNPADLREDGVYLNLEDWDLPSNSLIFVEVIISETPNGDKVMRILKKKLPG